jgi:hypothetical protein
MSIFMVAVCHKKLYPNNESSDLSGQKLNEYNHKICQPHLAFNKLYIIHLIKAPEQDC